MDESKCKGTDYWYKGFMGVLLMVNGLDVRYIICMRLKDVRLEKLALRKSLREPHFEKIALRNLL